jgi:hypothetical protein
MIVAARIRFALTAAVLAVAYFYLLVYLIGLTSARPLPGWWLGVFSNRHIGVITWVVGLHTAGVLAAALPIAVSALVLARKNAVQVGLLAGALATAAAVIPSLSPTILPLIWASEPVFFITDHVKIIAAVPILAWVLRAASSKNRFDRLRGAASVRQGEGR